MQKTKTLYLFFLISFILVVLYFFCFPTVYKYDIDKYKPLNITWQERQIDLLHLDIKFNLPVGLLNMVGCIFTILLLELTVGLENIPDISIKNIKIAYYTFKRNWYKEKLIFYLEQSGE